MSCGVTERRTQPLPAWSRFNTAPHDSTGVQSFHVSLLKEAPYVRLTGVSYETL